MNFHRNAVLATIGTIALSLGVLFVASAPAHAQLSNSSQLGTDTTGLGLSGQTNVKAVITSVLKTVLGLMALLAVVMVIVGGIIWMTSQGDEKKVGEAKKIIYSAVIGLVVIIFAYSIVTFVTSNLAS